MRYCRVLEELFGVVKDERGVQFQLGNPAGQRLVAVSVDFAGTGGGQVMRESLQFEGCSSAHRERAFQQGLKGDDDVLPTQTFVFTGGWQAGWRPAVYATSHLLKPAARYILAPKGAGITMALKPGRIDEQPFREVQLEAVLLSLYLLPHG